MCKLSWLACTRRMGAPVALRGCIAAIVHQNVTWKQAERLQRVQSWMHGAWGWSVHQVPLKPAQLESWHASHTHHNTLPGFQAVHACQHYASQACWPLGECTTYDYDENMEEQDGAYGGTAEVPTGEDKDGHPMDS